MSRIQPAIRPPGAQLRTNEADRAPTPTSQAKRLVPKAERRALDERTYERLASAGLPLKRREQVVLVDQSVEIGRKFELSTLPRHPIFSTTAVQRAAEMALSFDAFLRESPQLNARSFTLRPRGGTARPLELPAALKAFSAAYDDAIKHLVAKGLIAPLHSSVHIDWLPEVGRFDLHAHCVWNCDAADLERIRALLNSAFGSTWISPTGANNVGALVNYAVMGSIRHAGLGDWSDEALLAVGSLQKLRLHRPAGAFALFRRDMAKRGVRLKRTPFGIREVTIVRRPSSKPNDRPASGSFRGFRRVRIAGRVRDCAVHVRCPLRQFDEDERGGQLRGTFKHMSHPVTPLDLRRAVPSLAPIERSGPEGSGTRVPQAETPFGDSSEERSRQRGASRNRFLVRLLDAYRSPKRAIRSVAAFSSICLHRFRSWLCCSTRASDHANLDARSRRRE